ncbi:hypothetical protein GUITHDRAFT_154556 [Guillardia theta CCMP2712]|uniref:Uncharacterized protein n=3 Tax=Guillardia theta TaxID=55529 RepID=L1ISG7_GUITC|nr:hypothetical protein GUITHDRAFT_154556 [Guillardia theta CCMP2712]EKX39047.1 hypothetical protein GUITHDRAFT_154556 [Guillardia theta CCMP2712]|eukprot:XP_005826027.1 hypothetical protein GUITHDRAFT_154556 [Guillardia theta CCMP2712]
MRVILLLAAIAATCAIPTSPASKTSSVDDEIHLAFISWKNKFEKVYDGAEHLARFAVFKANMEIIRAHNALYELGEETFSMAANQFADMTAEEFKRTVLGYKPELKGKRLLQGLNSGKNCTHRSNNSTRPKAIDWRTKSAVTPVKNQGQCGSCWSFSTTGAVEGAWVVAGHPLISLSEEELVQCDTKSDQGCNGGLMDNAYAWIIQNGGIAAEDVYPYISGNGTTGVCHVAFLSKKVASISDWCDLKPEDESDLELALVQQPVAVAIEADQSSFQFYNGGVLPAKKCGTKLDHGVLAVGYGYDKKHKMHYWIVKNSWGAEWGDEGYIRLEKMPKKTKHSACGIAKAASYPTV